MVTHFQWFKSNLTISNQYAKLYNTNSIKKFITCGAPQDSILGPLLLLYINDIDIYC